MDRSTSTRLLAAHGDRKRLVVGLSRRFDGDVENAVSEAILRCAGADVGDEHHARAWTARTARGLAIDEWRHGVSARRHLPRLLDPPSVPSPEDLVIDDDFVRRVVAAIEALPPDMRRIVHEVAAGGSLVQIAQSLGRTPYAVKHLLHRARVRVKAALREA